MSWIIATCIIFVLMLLNSIFHPFDEDSRSGYKLLFIQGIEGFENKPAKIRIEKNAVFLDIDGNTFQINLKNVELLKEITEKDKSVIGRAVVGGLIFGAVGAIVGGMSGIGKKEIQKFCLKLTTNSYELYFKELPGYGFDFCNCYTKLKSFIGIESAGKVV